MTQPTPKTAAKRKQKEEPKSPFRYIKAEDGIYYWHCTNCAKEIPKGSRCYFCGKSKREKS